MDALSHLLPLQKRNRLENHSKFSPIAALSKSMSFGARMAILMQPLIKEALRLLISLAYNVFSKDLSIAFHGERLE